PRSVMPGRPDGHRARVAGWLGAIAQRRAKSSLAGTAGPAQAIRIAKARPTAGGPDQTIRPASLATTRGGCGQRILARGKSSRTCRAPGIPVPPVGLRYAPASLRDRDASSQTSESRTNKRGHFLLSYKGDISIKF